MKSSKKQRKIRRKTQKTINHTNKALDRVKQLADLTAGMGQIALINADALLWNTKQEMIDFAAAAGVKVDTERRA